MGTYKINGRFFKSPPFSTLMDPQLITILKRVHCNIIFYEQTYQKRETTEKRTNNNHHTAYWLDIFSSKRVNVFKSALIIVINN